MIRFVILVTLLDVGFNQLFPASITGNVTALISGFKILQDCSKQQVLESNIKYVLYNPSNKDTPVCLTAANLTSVDPALKVIFIIHGWFESSTHAWITAMKDKYLSSQSVNVIAVDWSYYSQTVNYGDAACAVPQVGYLIGTLIYNLEQQKGVALSRVLINGFSLGAQTAGFAGQTVQTLTNGRKIGQINGLDASRTSFLGKPTHQRLDKEDAIFVQGIHTSNGQRGYEEPFGTVDFQVTCSPGMCASTQPGCPLYPELPVSGLFETSISIALCNHFRAVSYFIESISSKHFLGFPQAGCYGVQTTNISTIMGESCPTTATGVLYLSVNRKPPFAKGDMGRCKP